MTLEQLEAMRAVRAERDATRARLLSGAPMTNAEREFEQQRMSELTRKEMDLEESFAAKQPPPASNAADLSPEQAASRAREIRSMPAYWRPQMTLKEDGTPVLTPEAHAQLKRELVEMDARANATGEE